MSASSSRPTKKRKADKEEKEKEPEPEKPKVPFGLGAQLHHSYIQKVVIRDLDWVVAQIKEIINNKTYGADGDIELDASAVPARSHSDFRRALMLWCKANGLHWCYGGRRHYCTKCFNECKPEKEVLLFDVLMRTELLQGSNDDQPEDAAVVEWLERNVPK
jgi:hypothetical protein